MIYLPSYLLDMVNGAGLAFGDDGSAKLSSAIGHWKLVKLEFLADNPLTLGVPGPCFPLG